MPWEDAGTTYLDAIDLLAAQVFKQRVLKLWNTDGDNAGKRCIVHFKLGLLDCCAVVHRESTEDCIFVDTVALTVRVDEIFSVRKFIK